MNATRIINSSIKLGFHLSNNGSIITPLQEAIKHKYSAFQMFISNPRSWKSTHISEDIINEFRYKLNKSNINANVHIPYLCNPSSPNEDVYKKSKEMLFENAKVCKMLGISLVIHMGSHLGRGKEFGINRIVSLLNNIIDEKLKVQILLENSSGYTNSMGSTLEEISEIINRVNSRYIGVCIDTAHSFAAGYNISTNEGVDMFALKIKTLIGRDKIKLFHLNDSKYHLGSKLDRHWHIGKGYIGKAGFLNFFSNSTFSYGTFIMETPVNIYGNKYTNWIAAKRIINEALIIKNN